MATAQQNKMKACARKCKGGGRYRSCVTTCLRSGGGARRRRKRRR